MLRAVVGIVLAVLIEGSGSMLAAEPTISEQVATFKLGRRLVVVIKIYGPEGGAVIGKLRLSGCLGSTTSQGFMFAERKAHCDPSNEDAYRIYFDQVLTVRPETRSERFHEALWAIFH